jgi:hypothetical protein
MQPELGIFVGKNLRLGGPEPVRSLEPMHGIGCAELARLDDKGKKTSGQTQKEKGIRQPTAEE